MFGAVHEMVAAEFPPATVTFVGAAGTTKLDAALPELDAGLVKSTVWATTVKLYAAELLSPPNVQV